MPVKDTMVFEEEFPAPLALDYEDKRDVLENVSAARWMYVNGILVGETYGHKVRDVDEFVPGVTLKDGGFDPRWDLDRTFYVYTTGILSQWQRCGYGQILKAHLLGVLVGLNFRTVIGHSKKNGSLQLNLKFGAEVIDEYPNWYGTGETYWMYRLEL